MDPQAEVEVTPEPQTTQEPPTDEQRLDALRSGFSLERTTETPAELEEKQEEQPAADPEDAPVTITKKQFAQLMAAAQEVPNLRATVDKGFGSFGNTLRDYGQRIKSFGEANGIPVLNMSDEEIAELTQDFPSLAAFATKLKAARPQTYDEEQLLTKLSERMGERIKPDELVQKAEGQAWKRFAKARASEIHDDWEQICNSDDGFATFVRAKGDAFVANLKRASDDFDYRVITSAVSDYKQAKKATEDKADLRRQRLNGNVTPRGAAPAPEPPRTREQALNAGFKSVTGR